MLEKRSIRLLGHQTSIALEPEFWAALEAIARAETAPLPAIIARVDRTRTPDQPLASALRVHALRQSRA